MQFNINGQIFELSEISVDFLEKYLQRVRKYIDKNNLESDLYLDIQERISEKFSELSKPISNKKVIDIINEIWEPEEIFSDLLLENSDSQNSKKNFYNSEKIKDFFSEQTTQRLTLSKDNAMIWWVCWGIAQKLWIDALWIRLVFLVGLFFFGITFVIYIALWILLPNEQKAQKVEPIVKTQNLLLSSQDKMIAWVCWGIAQKLGVDSLWIRFGFIIGAFFFGITFVIYIALWILLPKSNDYTPSQIVEESKKNLEEVKNKSSGICGKIFQALKNIIKFFIRIIIIWLKIFIALFALFIIFVCIAPILFLMGILFTDFHIHNQILFENVHSYLIFGGSWFLFMLLFFILGLIWKIFHGKIIANMLMIIGFLGSFVAIFIAGLGFFNSAINYTNVYSTSQQIQLDSYNQQSIHIDAFGKLHQNDGLSVNWVDFVEFKQTQQEHPYVEIESVINFSDEENAKIYFQNLHDFSVEEKNNDIYIWVDSIFKEKTTYQFLRRNIILYIPENKSVKLGNVTHGRLNQSIFINDEKYSYGLWNCMNKNISYLQDKQSFTCN